MTCSTGHFRLPSSSRNRRVLPVRAWLQTGVAAAALGLALTGAAIAAADEGDAVRGTSAESDVSASAPKIPAGPTRRDAGRAAASRKTAGPATGPAPESGAPRAAAAGPRSGVSLRSPAAATRRLNVALPAALSPAAAVSESPAAASADSTSPDIAIPALTVLPKASVSSSAAPVMTGLVNAVNGILDSLANLLSSFPAGPINDIASGALLLTRRALSLLVSNPTSTPTATSVWQPNAGTYGTGIAMDFVVNFDQPVVVVDTNVALPVEIDYHLYGAKYVSGSGTGSLLFSLDLPRFQTGFNGVSVGVVSSETGVREFGFDNLIVSRANTQQAVSNAIPTVNTSRIAVNSMGPQITGRSDLQVAGNAVTLSVNFDGRVRVTGTPTVPVSINGVDQLLTYTNGSGTSTLNFRYLGPTGTTIADAAFRTLSGDVIYLPDGTAGIRDQLGNPIYTLEGDINQTLYATENGVVNKMVVIGKHFEKVDTYSREVLDTILNQSTAYAFYQPSSTYPPAYNYNEETKQLETWPFWVPFANPTTGELPFYAPAENGVDVYRVSFRSWVPEQQRYTTDYGLMSIPTDAQGDIPVVVWQQPTVFNPITSAPSQAFSCGPTGCPQQGENESVRFQVAQFGGKGYAVFMPDVFGLGNSNKYNGYAYLLKASAAQWSTDFYNAATSLLEAQNLNARYRFLAGWSAGGVESAAWLENIESLGGTVDGIAVASSPLSTGPGTRTAVFSPRPWRDENGVVTNTGDAVWLTAGVGLNAFSLGGYQGLPGTALDTLGANYEIARRIYTVDYTPEFLNPFFGPEWPFDGSTAPLNGISLEYTDVNGVAQTAFMPYRLTDLIVSKYSDNPVDYDNSPYAKLVNAAGGGLAPWISEAYLQYSQQDEVMPPALGESVYSWQQQAYGKTNISFVETTYANHRGNFLIALQNYLDWFDSIIARG